MKNYIAQYKIILYLSWIVLYLIFPAWRIPGADSPFHDNIAITLFMVYFTISGYLINHYFNTLAVDNPFIPEISDWLKHIKSNSGLVIVCCLSVLLHIYTFPSINVVGETIFLRQTFWMYDFLNKHWQSFLDLPVQYFFWALIILAISILKQKKIISFISTYINNKFFIYRSNKLAHLFFIFFMFVFFNIYAYFFPSYSSQATMTVLRFPPVSRILYLISYFAFGISPAVPRIMQLTFYILGAVYLYRTICLFREKGAALLGASLYLFSPIIFSYASIAALASGTVFSIILVSFYFLRFLKCDDTRDLLFTAFFIGIGFLYGRDMIITFIVCFSYLVFLRIRKRDWNPIIHFKILLLSLIPILPWLKIGNTGAYKLVWSNLFSFDSLTTYSLMIQSQISLIVFLLFIFSIIHILVTKRNDLSLYWGLIFIAYYLFFTLMEVGELNHRYSMALYPTIAVFLSQFVYSFSQRIKWKHSFKLFSLILISYLIVICMIPRTSSSLITYKYKDFEAQYFPFDKATDWIRSRTENKEKILVLYLTSYTFYVDRIYSDKNGINLNKFIFLGYGSEEIIYPMQNLINFCNEENISYIMFPFSPKITFPPVGALKDQMKTTKYLKENSNNGLEEVAKFNIEDNYILIYKLKNNFKKE